ncbi:MAG: O-antigen ligase family protein [Steroidobacteraceae bacterium]
MRLSGSSFGVPNPRAPTGGRKPWPRDRRFSTLVVVMIWVVLGTMAVNWGWVNGGSGRGAGEQTAAQAVAEVYAPSAAMRFVKLALLAISIAVALVNWRTARQTLRATNRFFLAFMVMALLSALWSISPSDTIARYITLLSLVSVCFAFAMTNWYRERFQDVLRPLLIAICAGSLVIGFLMPDWIIEGGLLSDAWHGLLSQKNEFGQVAGFAAIFSLHGLLAREIKPWWGVLGLVVALACLMLSRSSTSLLAALFSLWLMLMLVKSPTTMRRPMRYVVAAFAVVVVLYAVTVLRIIPGFEILLRPVMMISGKDMTFSNRSVIWDIIKEHMARWPMLGAGYGGYWTGANPASPSYEFFTRMYFYPSQSHNGYLELANDLGYVGLIVLLGYLAAFVWQGIRFFMLDRTQGALLLALFFHQSVTNLSESTWLQISQPVGVTVMTLATFAMARTLSEMKRTGLSPPRRKV